MEIKLKSILLENFKGVKSSAINFDCASVNIYGDNATGKTTHLDAFIWCLFNKDSLNSTAFEIKALDSVGEASHNLTHSVTVTLGIDGVPLELKKVLVENWTRKRGEKSKQFTGHKTTYFIDEVPAKKKDFDKRITDIIDEKAFRLLTDARFFNETMTLKDRRELLVAVCGDITSDDIISTNPKLAVVPELLKGQSPDDARKRLNIQRKGINDELVSIPVRIDEATRSIVELDMPVDQAEAKIEKLLVERTGLEKSIAELESGGEAAKLNVELQKIRGLTEKAKNDFEAGKKARAKSSWDSITFLESEISKETKAKNQLDIDIARSSTGTNNVNGDLKDLRQEWHDIDTMSYDGSNTCPTCKQLLPVDLITATLENFNLSKAGMLKEVNAKGKALKETLNGLTVAQKTMVDGVARVNASIAEFTAKLTPFKADIERINAEVVDVSELTTKIGELEKQIQQAEAGGINDAKATLTTDLAENSDRAEELKAVIATDKANTIINKRCADLADSEELLVNELTAIEKQLFLIDQFTRARVDMLELKINGKFKIARFKMFSEQINGGLAETCETVLDGVPYGSINSAGRVQVGMDIIKTFQAHYGVSAPVWIDNRESIVALPEIDAQVISLIVSGLDKEIRVETA